MNKGCAYGKLKKIGNGSYGVVYKASNKKDEVAIKKLNDIEEMDIMDTILLASIKHPHINHVVDVLTHDECLNSRELGIVMPLASMDLFSYTEENLSVQSKWDVTVQLIDAVQALHSSGIWHLDIKPENVLIHFPSGKKSEPHIYLTDFGLSMIILPHVISVKTYQSRITPKYRPPELKQKKSPFEVWNTSDVYSLGITLLELWGGFTTESISKRLLDVTDRDLRNVLTNMLKSNPEKRWTMEQVIQSSLFAHQKWHAVGYRKLSERASIQIPINTLWSAFLTEVEHISDITVYIFLRAVDLFWIMIPYLYHENKKHILRRDNYTHHVTLSETMKSILIVAFILSDDKIEEFKYNEFKHIVTFFLKLTQGRLLRPGVVDRCKSLGHAVGVVQQIWNQPEAYLDYGSRVLPKVTIASPKDWMHTSVLKPPTRAKSATRVKSPGCSPDKIMNPETGRCVKRDGKIGKEISRKYPDA